MRASTPTPDLLRPPAPQVHVRLARTLVALVLLGLYGAYATQPWSIELLTGTSFKMPNDLHVAQAGHNDTTIRGARYETRPWSDFSSLAGISENYYSIRVGYQPPGAVTYEVEFIHDKAYYVTGADPTNVVQHFELSDGLNSLMGNLAFTQRLTDRTNLVYRIGAGLAIINPATVIRGRHLGTRTHFGNESRYYLAGLTGQVAVQIRHFLAAGIGFSGELKFMGTYAATAIDGGTATGHFYGPHFVFGIVWRP